MCNSLTHPPGCACGWGPASSNVDYSQFGYQGSSASTIKNLNDFATPRKCHFCNQFILFVQHNGGSVYLDLPPGAPWTKHHCYYENYKVTLDDKTVAEGIEKWSRDLAEPVTGIVYEVSHDKVANIKYLHVHCTDGKFRVIPIFVTFGLDGFVGEFVIFSFRCNILVRPCLSLKSALAIHSGSQEIKSELRTKTERTSRKSTR